MTTQPGEFTLTGNGLCVGSDGGDAVRQEYRNLWNLQGPNAFFVEVTVEKSQYPDLEAEAKRMMKAQ